MTEILQFFIRLSAFLGREIFAILRQPMLVLTLVLGPFLILLLFGIGFHNEAQPLRTLFVINDKESEFAQTLEENVTSLGPQLIYMGIMEDKAAAVEKLLRREVDVIAEVPADADQLIRNNQPVTIKLDHYEIDPIKKDYIGVFGRVYINEINRRVLLQATEQGQQESITAHESLVKTKETLDAMHQAMEAKNEASIQEQQDTLRNDSDSLIKTVGATVGLISGMNRAMGVEESSDIKEIEELLNSIDEESQSLENADSNSETFTEEERQLEKMEEDLDRLEGMMAEFQDIDADVLVRPFRSEPHSIATAELRPSDFFAPAVIALLLQHLAVTFAALSIVKERREGTMELFRVSPISAIETLLSKYLSYMLFAGVLSILLTGVVVFGLGVPMLGTWANYAATLAALIFTAIGIGFVISLTATTDSQAVQYSMILLLTSVFFSGAFIGLHLLGGPVKVVSWALPATYGISLLQDIMLRGYLPNPLLLWELTGIGVLFFFLAWYLLRRVMAKA
ncbi:MAG: ABC transporter permease [Anaerolineae bacterium]|nr:ABC transporter permease [Anaerolineae bacterium]